MTPEERRIRMEIGAEIIESAILDFLEENSGTAYKSSVVHRELGLSLNYNLCHGALQRLDTQRRILNNKMFSRSHNQWQALP